MKKVLIFLAGVMLAGVVSALVILSLAPRVWPGLQSGQSPDAAEAETPAIVETEAPAVMEAAPTAAPVSWAPAVVVSGTSDVSLYFTTTPEDEIVEDGGVRFGGCELLVQLQAGVSEEEARQLAASRGAELAGFIGVTGTCQWRFGEMMDYERIQALAGELESSGEVLMAMPNYIQDVAGASEGVPNEGEKWENEASWESSAPAEVNWGYVRSNALYAWQHRDEMTSPVKLAVIDFGFAAQDDLSLDFHNDFAVANAQARAPEHGDHVTGIAAATGGNGVGITGVYPKAEETGGVAVYDIAGTSLVTKCCVIADAVTSGMRVLNLSIGFQDEICYGIFMQMQNGGNGGDLPWYEQTTKQYEYVLRGLLDAGYDYLLVVSAGNSSGRQYDIDKGKYYRSDGKDEDGNEKFAVISAAEITLNRTAFGPLYAYLKNGDISDYVSVVDPCYSYPLLNIGDARVASHILCVGAYNRDGKVATFSNMGDRVDILAPGQDIWSTVAAADTQDVAGENLADNGTLLRMYGTSQAAPYVAGAAACVWSMNENFTSEDVRWILLHDPANTITDDVTGITKPVLNIEAAVRLAEMLIQGPEEQPDPTKKAVRFTVRSAGNGKTIDEYDVRLTAGDGTVQTMKTQYQDDTSSTGGIMYLEPGQYQALVKADHYRPLMEDIRVEDVEGLQEIGIELIPINEAPGGMEWWPDNMEEVDDNRITVSQSVIVWNGVTYICGDMYADMVPEDAQENVTFLPGSSAVMLAEDQFLALDRDGAIRLHDLRTDTAKDLVAAGGAAQGQFALMGTDIYYGSADGSIMLLDLWEPEKSGAIQEAAGGADDVWYMRRDGDRLAIASQQVSDRIWHCWNLIVAEGASSGRFRAAGSALTMDIELDGNGFVYASTPDGTILRYRDDGSDPEGTVVASSASPLFEIQADEDTFFTTLFWASGGSVCRGSVDMDPAPSLARQLAEGDCCAVLSLIEERVFFLRNIWENGTFTGYAIYSCSDEGGDERYHGRLMLSVDAAAQTAVQPGSGAQWDQLIAALAAQYGVVGTNDMSMYTGTGQQTAWQDGDLTGLLSAVVIDLDSDGEEELLTVRLDTYPEDFQGSGNTAEETHVWLQVYESDSSVGNPAAERMFYTTPTMVNSLAASGQMSVLAYEYSGTVYIGLDNYSTFNDTSTMMDLFTYKDGQLAFVKGMAYLEFGQGDVYVWQANTEPSGRWINASTGFWGLNVGWEEIASYLAADANWTAITLEEEVSYYELYRAGLAEYGLGGTDQRIWVNQTSGSSQDYYGLFAQDVYTADSGVRFIAGFGKFRQYDGQEMMVLRRMDPEGTLDAYRQ